MSVTEEDVRSLLTIGGSLARRTMHQASAVACSLRFELADGEFVITARGDEVTARVSGRDELIFATNVVDQYDAERAV